MVDRICRSADDKKAENIVIMEMRGKTSLCDVFIILSAPSTVRVKAIVDGIEEDLKTQEGLRVRHKEGHKDAAWVLMDYGPVIVHIFLEETRKFYQLEHLWGDAPRHRYLRDGA